MEHERFDRVVAAGASNGDGFSAEDIAWLLENAPGEILILRPRRKPRGRWLTALNGRRDGSGRTKPEPRAQLSR